MPDGAQQTGRRFVGFVAKPLVQRFERFDAVQGDRGSGAAPGKKSDRKNPG